MGTSLILDKSKRGPGTFTTSDMTLRGGKQGYYKIAFDIPAADLALAATRLEVMVEEYQPLSSTWRIIATKVIQGPTTKNSPLSVSWDNPNDPPPDRTIRATVSLATRITIGVSVTKED